MPMAKYIELIDKYLVTRGDSGTPSYKWVDNTGEIVHCADCKSFQFNRRGDGYLPIGTPEFECRHWGGAIDPIDFCSYGERKGGDAE